MLVANADAGQLGESATRTRLMLHRVRQGLASHAEGFHLRVLLKPCGNLSIHTASDVRLPTLKKRQWEKSVGLARRTRTNQSLAPFGRPRRRLNFQRAQRIR